MCYIAVLIVGLDPVIQFALIAHHTPNLVPCNDMQWIESGSSADKYMLHLEFTYQPSFNAPENEQVLNFFCPNPTQVPVHKIQSCFTIYTYMLRNSFIICKEEANVLLRLVIMLEINSSLLCKLGHEFCWKSLESSTNFIQYFLSQPVFSACSLTV